MEEEEGDLEKPREGGSKFIFSRRGFRWACGVCEEMVLPGSRCPGSRGGWTARGAGQSPGAVISPPRWTCPHLAGSPAGGSFSGTEPGAGQPMPPTGPWRKGLAGMANSRLPSPLCLVQAHRGMISWATENRSGTVGSPGWITGHETP